MQDLQAAVETGQNVQTMFEIVGIGETITVFFIFKNLLHNAEERLMNRINETLSAVHASIENNESKLNNITSQLKHLQKRPQQKHRNSLKQQDDNN